MAELKKIYRQSLPAMKFVGRSYGNEDKEKQFNTFSNKWSEWFGQNLFAPLQINCGDTEPFPDCNAYYGVCVCGADRTFRYWIGVFLPPDADVPDGYESFSVDAGDVAVCWIYGKEPDIYMFNTLDELKKAGYESAADKNGTLICFERYVCPRFTEPDADGNVILDMCFYIK